MESYSDMFNKICRVCGAPCTENMVSLFEDGSEKLSCYGKAICNFANVVISKKDNLPIKMCPSCLYQLRQAILFKMKCERNHQIFKIIVENEQSRNQIETDVVEYFMFRDILPFHVYKKLDKTNNFTDTDCVDDFSINTNDILKLQDTQVENIPTSKRGKKRLERIRKIMKLRESKPKSYQCDVCQKVLSTKGALDAHKWRHTEGRYICEFCGKGYPTKSELDVHMVHTHSAGKFLQCPHCEFKASGKHSMREHQRLHTGERPFACEQCGLTFRRRMIWRNHLLLHREKSVQCTQCPRRFHKSSDLKAHFNNVHERRFLYVCQHCGANYAKGSSMRKHYTERHGVAREEQGRLIRVKLATTGQNATSRVEE